MSPRCGPRPTAGRATALALLAGAADHGLSPDVYRAEDLARRFANLQEASLVVADVAAADVALSVSMLRYLRHLHLGRADPQALGFGVSAPSHDHDFAMSLQMAVEQSRVGDLVGEWAPQLALYRGLRDALARYRGLAEDPGLREPLPFTASVRPGDFSVGLRTLRHRLTALGDLTADGPPAAASSLYDGAIVDAVRAFQARHGLRVDGVIGRRTQEALRIPMEHRVRQIQLSLERLRWLPDLADRFIAVNIPMFHLWGWDAIRPAGVPSIDMTVIVGRALDTRTPVIIEEMRYVIFRPYWNIPSSIARGEILPALARDPAYLEKHSMEIVLGQTDAARPVPTTPDAMAQVRSGALRLRQRPGPGNSLGLVKFIFPNDDNVYLHGTPAPQLFSRPRRDLSHGCVRVEQPQALAQWVLADQPEWTGERIAAAMRGNEPRRVDLKRPIQVILFYLTAVVMPEDGALHVADDIYGHVAALERALALPAITR